MISPHKMMFQHSAEQASLITITIARLCHMWLVSRERSHIIYLVAVNETLPGGVRWPGIWPDKMCETNWVLRHKSPTSNKLTPASISKTEKRTGRCYNPSCSNQFSQEKDSLGLLQHTIGFQQMFQPLSTVLSVVNVFEWVLSAGFNSSGPSATAFSHYQHYSRPKNKDVYW